MKGVDKSIKTMLQLCVNKAHLPIVFQLISRDSKSRENQHENQAIPDLQPPFDGFENFHSMQ